MSKTKKNILIVDGDDKLEKMLREPLLNFSKGSGIFTSIVRARDGAEAATKSENQHFDLVVIDTDVPRLMDGGFVYGIRSYRNTQDAEVMVVSGKNKKDLPESLQTRHYFKKPVAPSDIIEALIEAINRQYHSEYQPTPHFAPKLKVDVRVINAVIKATTYVMKRFGCKTVNMLKATVKSPHEPLLGKIVSVMDIKSESFQGYLCISFGIESYLEVTSFMLMEEQHELSDENKDAVGEINNIIFGNAKSEISSFGVELTVPSVYVGQDHTVECPAQSAGMMIPFETAKGHFYITVIATPL